MIQISNLSKKYGETVVFSDLNYTFENACINKVFVRMFLRFRIMRYGTGYAIPHFLSRE